MCAIIENIWSLRKEEIIPILNITRIPESMRFGDFVLVSAGICRDRFLSVPVFVLCDFKDVTGFVASYYLQKVSVIGLEYGYSVF